MSKFADKYNRGSKYTFKTPKDFKFESLSDLWNNNGADYAYTVKAFYINKKSKFGSQPVVVTDSCIISLPKHLTEIVEEMIKDSELTEEINNGNFCFVIEPYEKNDNVYYSVRWL